MQFIPADMYADVGAFISSAAQHFIPELTYAVRIFGSDFNLAVWRFFVCPPKLNNVNIVL